MIPERIFCPPYSLVIGVAREVPHRDIFFSYMQVLHVRTTSRKPPNIEWLNHKSMNMNARKAKVSK